MTLKGKRILLGMTGGIAAYKAGELARLLVKAGCDVRVAMTEAATRFITPVTMQALTGQTVWTDLWDPRVADNMSHIELSRDRDLILVAPASADFMAKVAQGLADDLLSTLVLARRCGADAGAGDERGDVGQPGDATEPARAARGRRRLRGSRGRRPGLRRDRHGTHARAGRYRRRGRGVFPAEDARRQARAGDRGADRGADRPGARDHQFEFREDGLRGRARGARGRRRA